MRFKDKNNLIKDLGNNRKNILELGCGDFKRNAESISIDIIDLESVDIVADLNEGLSFLPDNSIDEIYSYHFLEHVLSLDNLLKEIYRVLKKDGIMAGSVPYFSHPFFYSDYTHKNFFGLYTFEYLSKESYFQRDVPKFYNDIDFKILDLRLEFESSTRKIRVLKKILQKWVNSSKKNQEFYEENLSTIIPASNLHFKVKKI